MQYADCRGSANAAKRFAASSTPNSMRRRFLHDLAPLRPIARGCQWLAAAIQISNDFGGDRAKS